MKRRTPSLTIDRALADRKLLGAALGDDRASWSTWLVVLKAAFGLALDAAELRVFAAVAGSRKPPAKRVRELWCIVGRRGGKSRMAAALAVYVSCFVQHRLAPGEGGRVLVLSASVEQSKTVFAYALAFLESSPALRQEIVDATRNEIRLKNGIVIAIHTNSFRTVRGRTLCAAIFDEISFWRDDSSATPDAEVYSAVLPALATTNGMLVGISSPYRRVGLLHQKHKSHFGVDGDDNLIVQGGSKLFNPSLDDGVIAAQRLADPTAASSEWDAQFRPDLAAFLSDDVIDSAVEGGRPLELPPQPGVRYQAFVDAAGGRGTDAYVVAIGHKGGEHFVVDVCRGVAPPFDPVETTRIFAELCKEYGVSEIVGDYHALGFASSCWQSCGLTYVRSELPKSQLYLEALPPFARGLVHLPDHPKLLRELSLLERHTHRSGKDTVDHPRGGSDDHANAVCGLLHGLAFLSAPVLWKKESFLVSGAPVPLPSRAMMVYCVLVAGKRGNAAACYFARPRIERAELIVLDLEVAPLTLEVFSSTIARLTELGARLGALGLVVFTISPLARELEQIGGVHVEIIDALLDEDEALLALSVSVHVQAERVKITDAVQAKSQRLPGILSPTVPTDQDNPARSSLILGVALGLDPCRSLTKPRAA
jgi:hypothetical protein